MATPLMRMTTAPDRSFRHHDMADTIVERAPAKVNLALHVTGRRGDGYHELDSLVAFTEFGDTVRVSLADKDEIVPTGPGVMSLMTMDRNIVEDARDALRAASPSVDASVRIEVEKWIPVAAGLGGGSADAAATLRALNRLWELDLSEQRLCEIGLSLGADVPMCVASRTAVARGIGEHLMPLAGLGLDRFHVVLVNPTFEQNAVSTPAVFEALANPNNAPMPPLPTTLEGTTPEESALEWLRGCRNDLLDAALTVEPAIQDVLDALNDALLARMSGSGATCFALYGTEAEADEAKERLQRVHPEWFVGVTRFVEGEHSWERR